MEAWIGFTAQPRGTLVVDDGARGVIQRQGKSLLAIGIVAVQGTFRKGDVVALRDQGTAEFARIVKLLRCRYRAH